MERLTVKDRNGNYKIEVEKLEYWCTSGDGKKTGTVRGQHIDKLAEYEDLEEQCIKENSWCLRMLLHKWEEFINDIQELYKSRKLEEQGKLLKLPCKLGDTTFWISDEDENGNKIPTVRESNPIIGIDIQKDGLYILTDGDTEYEKVGTRWAFLSREEAEAALKEMEDSGK